MARVLRQVGPLVTLRPADLAIPPPTQNRHHHGEFQRLQRERVKRAVKGFGLSHGEDLL